MPCDETASLPDIVAAPVSPPECRRGRWRDDTAGVAAVEFALVLPVMVAMLLGMTEVTVGVNSARKLTLVSRSIADLTSRSTTALSASDISNTFAASQIIMQPYSSAALRMTLSSMKVTYNTTTRVYSASVDWSCASGTGAATKPVNVTYSVPSGFQKDGSHYILAETVLPYKPMFGSALTGTLWLNQPTPWPVRNISKATLPSSCLTGCVCPDPA